MGNCAGKGASSEEHPGLVLDRVASQPSAEEVYPLYRLANYRKGGELLDAYATGGRKAVEKIIQDHLRLFMYHDGAGKVVTEHERKQWKNRQNGEVRITIEDPGASTDKNSHCNHSQNDANHEACWSLEYRGALGETLLHVLLICDTKTHVRIAKLLLKHFPRLAIDITEGPEFYGLAYFGEYPLAWAACFENEAIYNFLLDHGAHPNMQDSFGNMVLHMLVINDKLSMYGYALRHPKTPAKNGMVNAAGLTPLTLACTLGRNEIFKEMLELSSVEFWRYSNITCSAYPLNAVDTILPNGQTNWKSALMIILRGSSDQHLDMLEGGVVQRLLEDKWKTYARRHFLIHLGILFQHLIILSIAVYLRPLYCASTYENEDPKKECDDNETSEPIDCDKPGYLSSGTDARSIVRYCTEIASIINSSNYIILQQGQEIWAQGIQAYMKTVTQSPAKLVFLLANLLILSCIPCRIFQNRFFEDIFLSLALPGGWFFLIFFAGAVRLTGPFVTMIYNMIAGDMVRFGVIYLIILLGFSQAFFFLFKDHTGKLEHGDELDSYIGTWMALFHMTLGAYEYGNFEKTRYLAMTRIVFVIFMIMVPILLLNMLIAMMGNTYIQVINKSEKEFVKQWANIVLTLERSLSQKTAGSFLDTYAINLKPATDTEEQIKGLMVIKSKNITKAKQRNRALFNWKRTRTAIRVKREKYNCGGADLLDIIKKDNLPKGESEDPDATPRAEKKKNLGYAVTQLISATGIDLNAVVATAGSGLPTPPLTSIIQEELVKSSNHLPQETRLTENKHDMAQNPKPNLANEESSIDKTNGYTNLGFTFTEVENQAARTESQPKLAKKKNRKKKNKLNQIEDSSETTELVPQPVEKPKKKRRKKKKHSVVENEHCNHDPSVVFTPSRSFEGIQRQNASVVPMTVLLDSKSDEAST
uniref:Ion transport domain-containing protein n=1 Tax=Strigamia maritima TaxID=126957 RepID=T1IMS0_STRMM